MAKRVRISFSQNRLSEMDADLRTMTDRRTLTTKVSVAAGCILAVWVSLGEWKKLSLLMLLLYLPLMSFGEIVICPRCREPITDAFCTNCGMKRPDKTVDGNSDKSNPYYLPYPLGFFRGATEVVCSPLNVARGGAGLFALSLDISRRLTSKPNAFQEAWASSIFFMAGMIAGCVPMVGDICVGGVDMLTLGMIGNEAGIWDDSISTPYIFERCWIKEESHGQKNAYLHFVK